MRIEDIVGCARATGFSIRIFHHGKTSSGDIVLDYEGDIWDLDGDLLTARVRTLDIDKSSGTLCIDIYSWGEI